MPAILIDTRIWVLALKSPFLQASDPEFQLAGQAQAFVSHCLQSRHQLLLSSQLLAEVFHVMTQRGRRVRAEQAARLVGDLLLHRPSSYRSTTKRTFRKSLDLSSHSGVHIWDYLVVLPFEGHIDHIYTMDPHFQDPSFTRLAAVSNPLAVWKAEGES